MRAPDICQQSPSTAQRSRCTVGLAVVGLLSFAVAQAFIYARADQPASPPSAAADEKKLKAADLKTDGPALLAFLKSRSLSDEEGERVDILIAELGASSFKVREQAAKDLIAKGPAVLAALHQGLAYPDQEVQRRCDICIKAIKSNDRLGELSGAVVRLLAERHPAGTVEALLAYLPFVDNDAAVDDIRAALARLANGARPDNSGRKQVIKTLAAALTDKLPVRRLTAGEALILAGAVKEHKKALEALLNDRDAGVRGKVALALVQARDKAAVPVLIDSLTEVTQLQALEIEETLCRLAGALTSASPSPPAVSLGSDAADRVKFQSAWDKWWKDNGAAVDMAALGKSADLGWTTMILLEAGRVIEVDKRKNIRWQIDNLEFPLDLQVLDKGRVLIAEYYGNKVTERNFAGQILWEMKFPEPQMAQRLANGNTFIASKSQMAEIDPNGNKVFSFAVTRNLGPDEGITKCVKQPNGEITRLYSDGEVRPRAEVIRSDASGRELSRFQVELRQPLFGGRIQVLPNGNVLIPHKSENKVAEYDGTKEVWKLPVEDPIIATRLANGNTLVTINSMTRSRAVELTTTGEEVWEYRVGPGTRVTRALRR